MFFSESKDKMRSWFVRNAESKNALWWLLGISFAESSFFPIPPDPFLMAVLMVKRQSWLVYSLLTTIASVLGGIFGYFIGYVFFETVGKVLVDIYNLGSELEFFGGIFGQYTFWTTFTVAFTPIPYKVFTIAAGLFEVSLPLFILASVIGRGLRFFIIGLIMKLFGDSISKVVFKYFNWALLILTVLIIAYLIHQFI